MIFAPAKLKYELGGITAQRSSQISTPSLYPKLEVKIKFPKGTSSPRKEMVVLEKSVYGLNHLFS